MKLLPTNIKKYKKTSNNKRWNCYCLIIRKQVIIKYLVTA